jgi:hypothetical protein
MVSSETKRPNYRDGQYLLPGDFVAEQRYHSDLRRRLALGQHTWGIFAGLELLEVPVEGDADRVEVFVTPGLAIDGFGRELIAYAPQKLDVGLFLNPTQPPGWVAVWIRYLAELADPPRYGYEICDDPEFASRTRETFRIEVGERPVWHDPVIVAGKEVLDEELPVDLSVPHQGLPDDSEDARWRVLLGYAHWDGVGAFIKSETDVDHMQRSKGRVHGGVVAAHTYPPADEWELATRRRPGGGDPVRVLGTVRGKLVVEDVIVALGEGVELHDSPLAFFDDKGEDRGRPLRVTRVDDPNGADLRLQLGSGTSRENRLVIDSGKKARVVIRDDGSVDLKGDLHVGGVLDLVEDDGDRIVLWGKADDDLAAAIGVEDGGTVLYSRAENLHRWYLEKAADGGGSAQMVLASSGLAVRGNAIVGWHGNGRLRVRHVDGKEADGDGLDDLYLNWNSGRDVHVGSSVRASLHVHGNATVGAGGNGILFVRHVDGKDATTDAVDALYLNWDTGQDVVVGKPGNPSDLIVHGGLYLGSTKIPVDVAVGNRIVNLSGQWPNGSSGSFWLPVTTRLPTISQASLTVALSDIQNNNEAVGARWRVWWSGAYAPAGPNQWQFLVNWQIDDIDGHIFGISWTAVFVP